MLSREPSIQLPNRCWNILEFAIRMGQSIGLHVESALSCNPKASWMLNRVHWRRTWYSMYVLDRLLAFQLGRPMAIYEAGFHVDLPSVKDNSPFDLAMDEASLMGAACSPAFLMNYFLKVIHFSHIVGLVIQELYCHSLIGSYPDQMLYAASVLDQRLDEFKVKPFYVTCGSTWGAPLKGLSFANARSVASCLIHPLV